MGSKMKSFSVECKGGVAVVSEGSFVEEVAEGSEKEDFWIRSTVLRSSQQVWSTHSSIGEGGALEPHPNRGAIDLDGVLGERFSFL